MSAGAPLVSGTVRLERGQGRVGPGGTVDLVALAGDDGVLWEREGAGFAAWGEVARVPAEPAAVARVLGEIATEGDGAAGADGFDGAVPIAVGALPFDDAARGWLVVPSDVVWRDAAGRAWHTWVRPEPATDGAHDAVDARWRRIDVESTPTRRSPDQFTLRATMHHEAWCALVADAVESIAAGDFDKVVLAREVTVEADRPFVLADVLGRLRALYPSCTTFSVEGFLGASPELLVSRRGRTVRSHPLAGTIPRSGDPEADARAGQQLLASPKDRSEHALVVDAVCDVLRGHCEPGGLRVPDGPSLYALRNVSHLGTVIEGDLRAGTAGTAGPPAPSALALALELHPTPAVGGTPRQEALDHLAKVEQLDRGRYAGPVGWVDARGDGEWYVGIRSAEVSGNRARMIAGNGIVADSDPAAELLETQLKLQALLAALVRP